MPNTRDIELAVGRALAKAYPWLMKVERLPGGGLLDTAALIFHPEPAANEPRFGDPPDRLAP